VKPVCPLPLTMVMLAGVGVASVAAGDAQAPNKPMAAAHKVTYLPARLRSSLVIPFS
jgi:hypothetical protein